MTLAIPPEMPRRVAMVSGDFVLTGGMDRANYALAEYLARQGVQVELVAHRIASQLSEFANVKFHRVPKPTGSYFLGAHSLARRGRAVASEVLHDRGQVVVNGGNCTVEGVNWVHYIHAAYVPENRSLSRRLKQIVERPLVLQAERRALAKAGLVIANSDATRGRLIEQFSLDPAKVKTIYYGIDAARFRPSSEDERAELRSKLGWDASPRILFIGALGDRRKGFDTLAAAWNRLQRDDHWDARLVVIGTGAERSRWEDALAVNRPAGTQAAVDFLGFRSDVPDLLRAADCLVAPTRYEAYGLGVREAICCGLPAFVSASAGVAEHYTAEMKSMILDDPDDDAALAERLRAWRGDMQAYQAKVEPLGQQLRARTWDQMASEIVQAMAESHVA